MIEVLHQSSWYTFFTSCNRAFVACRARVLIAWPIMWGCGLFHSTGCYVNGDYGVVTPLLHVLHMCSLPIPSHMQGPTLAADMAPAGLAGCVATDTPLLINPVSA